MRIEKGFAWGFVGILLAILTFFVGYFFPHQSRPDVGFAILNETDISNHQAPIPGLQVLFQGEDLHSQNKSLRSIQVRVENTGDADVLPSHYDERLQWGISVTNGTVVRVLPSTGSNDYLRTNMKLQHDGNQVILPRVILEQGQFAAFEILVVHPDDVAPSIVPFGKIAGVKDLEVHREVQESRYTMLERTWAGPLQVQLLRLLSYFLGMLIIAGVIAAGVDMLKAAWSHMLMLIRSRRILSSKHIEGADPNVKQWLRGTYVSSGRAGLLQALDILKDPARLVNQVSIVARAREQRSVRKGPLKPSINEIRTGGRWWFSDESFRDFKGRPTEEIGNLLDHQVVSFDENGATIVAHDAIPTIEAVLTELHGQRKQPCSEDELSSDTDDFTAIEEAN